MKRVYIYYIIYLYLHYLSIPTQPAERTLFRNQPVLIFIMFNISVCLFYPSQWEFTTRLTLTGEKLMVCICCVGRVCKQILILCTGYFRKVYRSLQVRVPQIFWIIYLSKSCRQKGVLSVYLPIELKKKIYSYYVWIL